MAHSSTTTIENKGWGEFLRAGMLISLGLFIILVFLEQVRPLIVSRVFNYKLLFWAGVFCGALDWLIRENVHQVLARVFLNRLFINLLLSAAGGVSLFYILPTMDLKIKLLASLPVGLIVFFLLVSRSYADRLKLLGLCRFFDCSRKDERRNSKIENKFDFLLSFFVSVCSLVFRISFF